VATPPCRRCWITGRIPGLVRRAPKGALTWTGELVKQRGLEPLEPKGKLDT
jgi:hypothetical protein